MPTKKPTIGIIGGMGPMAGVDLHRKLIEATAASTDQDHWSIVHVALPSQIADRTGYLLHNGPDPYPGIEASAKKLIQTEVDLIVVACNTAHAPPIWSRLEAYVAANAPQVRLISMIEAVCQQLKAQTTADDRIAVLSTKGTQQTGLYQNALSASGLTTQALSEGQIEQVHQAIYHPEWGIKSSQDPAYKKASEQLSEVLDQLAAQNTSHAILGCTELPLALTHHKTINLIDPAQALIAKVQQALDY